MKVAVASILQQIWCPLPSDHSFHGSVEEIFQNDLAICHQAIESGTPIQALDHTRTINDYLSLYNQIHPPTRQQIMRNAAHRHLLGAGTMTLATALPSSIPQMSPYPTLSQVPPIWTDEEVTSGASQPSNGPQRPATQHNPPLQAISSQGVNLRCAICTDCLWVR